MEVTMRILMFEEKQIIRELIEPVMHKQDWQIDFVTETSLFSNEIKNNLSWYDFIIIDINYHNDLTLLNDVEIMQQQTVIYLTVNVSEIIKQNNVHIITKPFSPRTLVGKIKQIIFSDLVPEYGDEYPVLVEDIQVFKTYDIETSHFKLNFATREVLVDDQVLEHLTLKEYELLKTLIQKPRQVFSREHLLNLIWDLDFAGDERTIDVHIKTLRKKIPVYGAQVIQTVWGVGYKFDEGLK